MASLFESLAVTGHRKSDGSANASGRMWAYKPGTTSPATIYADTDENPLSNPVTLSAGGKARVFFAGQVDVFFEDSTGVAIETLSLSERAERVEVKNAGFTGLLPSGSQGAGGVTDLNAVLTSLYTSTGGLDGKYLEFTGATARKVHDVLQGIQVSVKDYGAVGNGVADDTIPIQNAINEVGRLGGGVVYFDPGTYVISSALTLTTSSVFLSGAGAASIIKNSNGSANALTVTGVSDVIIEFLKITHSTSSTGIGISVVNSTSVTIRNVTANAHAKVVSISGSSTRTRIADSALTLVSGTTNVGVYYNTTGLLHSITGTSVLPTSGGKLIDYDGATSYCSVDACFFQQSSQGGIVFEATLTGTYFIVANSPSLSQFAGALSPAFVCGLATIPIVTQFGNGIDYQGTASGTNVTSGGTFTPGSFLSWTSDVATGTTVGAAYNVAAPNPALHASQAGKIVTLTLRNAAGTPVTGWSFNAIYVVSAIANTADAQQTSIMFRWNGTKLYEIGRAVTST